MSGTEHDPDASMEFGVVPAPDAVPGPGAERRIRALHVVRPAIGGMKEHVFDLCDGLRARGHVVEVACPRASDIAGDARGRGLTVHEIDLVGPLRPLKDLAGVRQVAAIVRAGSFDLIHAHGFKAGLVARLGGSLGKCPVRIVTVHNHVMYRDDISAFTKWRYRTVERALSRMTSRIIAVSNSLRDELVSAYGIDPDRIVTIHNGVDARPFVGLQRGPAARAALGLPGDCLVVGTAARLAPQKDLRCFVDAAARVLEDRSDVRFVLGGEGPMRDELKARIAERGIADRMQMLGFVKDMPGFVAALDVYVSSSLSEGLPLTFVEVGAAGVPIVATDAGGTSEIVRDGVNGALVPPADPDALARGIERLLDDAPGRERMGEEGRRIALSEFAPEVMIERTLSVYAEALSGV